MECLKKIQIFLIKNKKRTIALSFHKLKNIILSTKQGEWTLQIFRHLFAPKFQNNNDLGKVSKKIKMVGFIQCSSHPSQPGRALDKKKSKFTQFFLCLYHLYNHQIWRELWRKNWYLLLLKCFGGQSESQKVWLTAGISTLTPPIRKN